MPPHMTSHYGQLQPTNGWDLLASLGHLSKFQRVLHLGFVTAATSHNGSQPNFARCLAVSWTGTPYIHFRGHLPLNRILPCAKFTLCQSLAFSYIINQIYLWQRYCTALEQWASAKVCGVVQGMELRNIGRRRHLYLGGQPSRWASAHILVSFAFSPLMLLDGQWEGHPACKNRTGMVICLEWRANDLHMV